MPIAHPDAVEYATRRCAARAATRQADATSDIRRRFDLRTEADYHAGRAGALFTGAEPGAWRQITALAVVFDKDRHLADAAEALRRADLAPEMAS